MTNNKQQTAVEWLIEQFYNNEGMLTTKKLLKAKEIEKEKLEDAWVEGFKNWNPSKTFEDYYNETYGGGDK
jgi:hypothetical protein